MRGLPPSRASSVVLDTTALRANLDGMFGIPDSVDNRRVVPCAS